MSRTSVRLIRETISQFFSLISNVFSPPFYLSVAASQSSQPARPSPQAPAPHPPPDVKWYCECLSLTVWPKTKRILFAFSFPAVCLSIHLTCLAGGMFAVVVFPPLLLTSPRISADWGQSRSVTVPPPAGSFTRVSSTCPNRRLSNLSQVTWVLPSG